MIKQSLNQKQKVFLIFTLSIFSVLIVLLIGDTNAQAKTYTIKTPEQLKNINWKNKGYGPGNTYKIGNDFTLGDGEYANCRLTKGKFVIDFNGHTVQNANHALGVFTISGANVVFKDSKVSNSKPSVRSYGAGAIDMTSGKLLINSGNYIGVSDGTNNPVGLHVGGGTCVVNGGYFYGATIGADCSGGILKINGGTFQTGYMFALGNLGNGNIKISKANFISGTTTYGYKFAIGAFNSSYQYYNFNNWLASGSSFSPSFQTGYWNMQSQISAQPFYGGFYAVAYNTPTLSVKSSAAKPKMPSLKSLKSGKKLLKINWKKQKKNTSGYQIQYSTSSSFKKNKKTVTVKGFSKTSKTVKKLKNSKKYYVRIRAYRSFNGTKLYSKWSKAKSKRVK